MYLSITGSDQHGNGFQMGPIGCAPVLLFALFSGPRNREEAVVLGERVSLEEVLRLELMGNKSWREECGS